MRLSLLLPALLLALPACSEPSTCEHDVSSWWRTEELIAQATSGDGSFRYDPGGVAETERVGSFDQDSGELSYEDAFIPGHKYVHRTVEGTLLLREGGDWALSIVEDTLDVLGEHQVFQGEIQRTGCEGTKATTDEESESFPQTTTWTWSVVSPHEMHWSLETTKDDEPYVQERIATSDLRTTYTIDIGDGRLTATGAYEPTGVHHRHTTEFTETRRQEEDLDWQMDGSLHMVREGYSLDDDTLEFVFVVDYAYDGSATGTYTRYEDGEVEVCEYGRDAVSDPECDAWLTCGNSTVHYDC